MSEDIYAKLDLTKKVRFQAAVKKDRDKDVCDDPDNVNIYDNYRAEESTPPQDTSPDTPQDTSPDNTQDTSQDTSQDNTQETSQDTSPDNTQDTSQDNTTEDQEKTASVNVSSGKRTLPRAPAVFLGLLCLLLLVAVIVLVVVFVLERSQLTSERDELQKSSSQMERAIINLTSERNELQKSSSQMKRLITNVTNERNELQNISSQMKSLNANLTIERDELQNISSQMKSLITNLTQKTSQLEGEKDLLTSMNNNLTTERDEFKRLVERISVLPCCPNNWSPFGFSCYLKSTTSKTWEDSRTFCRQNDAYLVIISSEQEQIFLTSLFSGPLWIGMTDRESEGNWTWVDGTAVTTTYWNSNQPDNWNNDEHCAYIQTDLNAQHNWNDLSCNRRNRAICEKMR